MYQLCFLHFFCVGHFFSLNKHLYTDVDVVCDVDAVTLQMNTVNVYIKVVTTLRCERVSIHL